MWGLRRSMVGEEARVLTLITQTVPDFTIHVKRRAGPWPPKPDGVCQITYHTIPYHTIPYHTLPYHTLPYHTLPYLTLPYHTLPYLTIPYLTIPYHIIPYLPAALYLREMILSPSLPPLLWHLVMGMMSPATEFLLVFSSHERSLASWFLTSYAVGEIFDEDE
jgi:hypothetical protein